MRAMRRLVPVLLLATALPAGTAPAEDETPTKPLTWTGGIGVNAYYLQGAYLGSPDQPGKDPTYGWVETIGRAGLAWSVSDHVTVSGGVAGLFTLWADPFGLDDDGAAVVESAKLAVTDLFTPGLDVTIGRQEMKIGDGFLVQDGYYDHAANVWSIPLTFWDSALDPHGRREAGRRPEEDGDVEERLGAVAPDEGLREIDPAVAVEVAADEVGAVVAVEGPQVVAPLGLLGVLVGRGPQALGGHRGDGGLLRGSPAASGVGAGGARALGSRLLASGSSREDDERRREEGEAGQERRAGEAAGRHASPFFFPGTGSPIFRRTCWRSSQASFFLSGWRRRKDGW